MQQDPYHLQIEIQEKNVHFDEDALLSNTLDKLSETLSKLSQQFPRNQSHDRSPHPSKPYKPYITRGRHQEIRNRSCSHQRDHGRPHSHHNNDHHYSSRDCNRNYPQRDQFDKSPTTRRSRSSGHPVNKDKDCCFRCHEYGHFAKECPNTPNNSTKELVRELHAMKEDIQNLYAMQQAYTWPGPEAYPEAYPNGLHQAEQQQPLNN